MYNFKHINNYYNTQTYKNIFKSSIVLLLRDMLNNFLTDFFPSSPRDIENSLTKTNIYFKVKEAIMRTLC